VNEIIRANVPVQAEFLPRAEAERIHNLERLPAEAGASVRIIHIGEYDAARASDRMWRARRRSACSGLLSLNFENGALRVRFKLDSPG